MPPSFKGGLLCAMAALAAKTSTEARTPETIRFIKTSLRTCRIALQPLFRCHDHAGRRSQRQARCRAGNRAAVLADDIFRGAEPSGAGADSRQPAKRTEICYSIDMAKQKKSAAKGAKAGGFVVGRARFTKISAVEGIRSPMTMKKRARKLTGTHRHREA